ncbi:MAG TPA: GTPase Era [Rhodocyclaceae bacterium]|nr:GTPase Era [Rhodocyclaceae bacterium]HNH99661.1 GTPase Era [Rhodocyclaceae bacterium]
MTELDNTPQDVSFRTGYVAIVGRPNVGKSTLLNRLVGQKVSIVSRKAQTTRHRIAGILTTDTAQLVFVDTPGFQTTHRNALNRAMNRNVVNALSDVDAVALMLEAGRFGEEDRAVIRLLPDGVPVVVVINKVDRLNDKSRLLPFIAQLQAETGLSEFVPISAEKGQGVDALVTLLRQLLPEGAPIYAPDDITDRSERFLAAEFLREKIFRQLGEELPYGVAVEIEKFEQKGALRHIHAAIIVDKDNHKGIVIGEKGARLKRIGADARRDLESLFGGKVFLELWVKVKSGWADDERAIKSLGYE